MSRRSKVIDRTVRHTDSMKTDLPANAGGKSNTSWNHNVNVLLINFIILSIDENILKLVA